MSADPSAAEIRARMAVVRADLVGSVDQLKLKADRLTDWRLQVRRHPWLAFGVAGLVGYAVVSRRAPVSVSRPFNAQANADAAAVAFSSGRSVLLPWLASASTRALLRLGAAWLGQYINHSVRRAAVKRAAADQGQCMNGTSTGNI